MKFTKQKLNKRFPEIECNIYVLREPYREPGAGDVLSNLHRGTAAAIIMPDGRFWVGVALCSPMDQFSKEIGRLAAVGRAYKAARTNLPYGMLKLDEPIRDGINPVTEHLKTVLNDATLAAKRKVGQQLWGSIIEHMAEAVGRK